jgi:hypothetical protein
MDTGETRQPIIFQFVSKYFKGEIGIFAAKAMIAAVVALGAMAIGANIVAAAIDNTLQRTIDSARARLAAEVPKLRAAIRDEIRIGGRGFWVRFEDELDRLAKSDDPPPQKKQKVLSDLRVISAKWRPFLLEATAVVTGETTATVPGNAVLDQNNRSRPVDRVAE